MDRPRLLQLVTEIGHEFRRREMHEHLRRARLYYLAIQHGLDRRGDLEVAWNEQLVVEWCRLLEIEPYQGYPVRRRGEPCACGEAGPGTAITEMVFPGGAKMSCRRCGAVWVVR